MPGAVLNTLQTMTLILMTLQVGYYLPLTEKITKAKKACVVYPESHNY